MRKRLVMALAAGALVAAMAPGAAAAAAPTAYATGGCDRLSFEFNQLQIIDLQTADGLSYGQVRSGYLEYERTCLTPQSYGSLYVNGVLFDSFPDS